MTLFFELNDRKNRINRKKHGLSFDEAQGIFSGPGEALTIPDRRKAKRRLKETKAIPDEDIDYSDIHDLGDDFFRQAEVWMPLEKPKAQLTVRFDPAIVDWFRKQDRGHQTRMNALLRACMKTRRDHKHEPGKP